MKKRIVKNNIKKTLFFSYSIIFSTLFFVSILMTHNQCDHINNNLKLLHKKKYNSENRIKSLNRKKSLRINSIENIAYKQLDFIVPEPQPTIIPRSISR